MPAFGDLFDRLDSDANVRGRQFEHICKWYLTHAPVYRRILRQVWLWDEWPGRKGPDTGIDLVAEDRTGDLWAIQAKAYSPEHTVTKRDIDTFLAASATSEFSFRLLIATTALIGANARRTVEAQDRPVHLHMRTDLAHAEIDWPTTPDDLRAPRPPIKMPRLHQQEAIAAVVEGFESRDRGQMIMACGTGKTLTALWITEHLDSDRTLILVPSLSLLKDTLREWTAQASTDFSFLPVCSDPTVRGSDDWVSSTTELGIPVTTDPDEITAFLQQDGPLVVFSTYQSSPRVAEALSSDAVPGFDLVIADEAHRVAGPVSSDFATVLDNSAIRSRRRLFTTATPRFFTDRVREEAGEAEFEIASMNDETKFGPEFHRLSFGEAIERDLLSDYQVAIIGVDDPTYRKLAEHGVLVTRDGTEVTDARTLASHIGLAKAMHDFDLRKTISFHSRINRARDFATDFPDVVAWMPDDQKPDGELITSHVSGKMTAGQRDLRIQQLDDIDDRQRGLLSNARCLGEGIDVPTLDGVAFIDPRRSHIDIIQAVGRAIRKAEDKTIGTIVLPVFIDATEDPDTALNSSAFKPIWSVLKALRSHDDDLAEQLDELRRQLGREGKGFKLPPKLRVDLPATIDEDFVHAFETRLVESSTANWEFWYGLLERFVKETESALVPAWYTLEGHKLGLWVSNQRARRTLLTASQVMSLESLPGWVWHARASKWDRAYALLVEYAATEGHSNVGQSHIVDGFPLGAWANTQRAIHRNGDMPDDRALRLEALANWEWEPLSDRWDQGREALLSYARREGDCHVPAKYEIDEFKLGVWVGTQRMRHRQGSLSIPRIEALEMIPGWSWEVRTSWEHKLAVFDTYLGEGGSTRPGRGVVADGLKLGEWVAKQRGEYRKGEMSEDRVAKMESLPGWSWNPVDNAWEGGFDALVHFASDEGHARPTRTVDVNGFKLGQWVASQRTSYRQGRLSDERTRRLEALPGWAWGAFDKTWDSAHAHLLAYTRQFGNSLVPDSFVTTAGFNLGSWVAAQRRLKRTGGLADDRIARLELLRGWSWDPVKDKWGHAFAVFCRYVDREGTVRVARDCDEDGVKLGRWVEVQRRQYKKGKLALERARLLEGIEGWTWGTSNKRNTDA